MSKLEELTESTLRQMIIFMISQTSADLEDLRLNLFKTCMME